MRRKKLSTSHSPENHGGGYKQMLRKDRLAASLLVDAPLDSTAGGRPRFHTTQWLTVAAASAKGTAGARAALEELYRLLLSGLLRQDQIAESEALQNTAEMRNPPVIPSSAPAKAPKSVAPPSSQPDFSTL
jgi:hypothetical protein